MKLINEIKADLRFFPNFLQRPTRTNPSHALAGRVSRTILTVVAALFVSAAATHAQTWQTVDDAAGATSEKVYSITSDSAGNTFASGTMVDATGRYHAVITKSSDGGATWGTVVDYPGVDDPPPVPPGNGIAARFDTVVSANVAGGGSHLVAAGVYRRGLRPGTFSSYTPQWLTIRSRDGGATWETLDEYLHPTYNSVLTPRDVAVDANGNIYVVGMAVEYTSTPYVTPYACHWLIRKGVATPGGGMTWSTVGDFAHGDGSDSAHVFDADGASGVACVGASVFVVGSGANSWIVRKSSNGGSTWQVVDTYQYGKNLKSHAFDVAADSAGNVYVAGYGQKLGTRWVVRKGTIGGTKWSTVDDFRLSGGSYAEGRGIAIDASNNVHVTGMAASSQGKWNWVTRQRSAATGTWSTTDLFSLAANQDTAGRSITADPAGNLFAAGYGYDSAGVNHGWLVRRKLAP